MSINAILKESEAITDTERERLAAGDANPNAGYSMEEVIAYVKRKK